MSEMEPETRNHKARAAVDKHVADLEPPAPGRALDIGIVGQRQVRLDHAQPQISGIVALLDLVQLAGRLGGEIHTVRAVHFTSDPGQCVP